MKFSVETWAPEYGISTDENQLDGSTASVDIDLETPGDKWAPRSPGAVDLPETVMFIDGIRRIDARVWITNGDRVMAGVCATVAAGAVLCDATTATVVDAQVLRGLFTSPSDDVTAIETRHGPYRYFPCAGETPEDLYLGIHNKMTDLETEVSSRARADLLVFDGPLRTRSDALGVGYIKTQHVQYLPEEQRPVLAQLEAGQRTPLFLVAGGRGVNRYSWYLRLPAERTQPWAGIVRCEVAGEGSVADAIRRADQVTALLPRYASEPHKDGRAPQNLYPIAGLEYQLRRRLGDQLLMERALRRAAPRPD